MKEKICNWIKLLLVKKEFDLKKLLKNKLPEEDIDNIIEELNLYNTPIEWVFIANWL